MFWAILFMFQTICDSSYCYFDHSFKQIIGLVIIGLLSAALRIVLTKVLNYYFPNFKTNRSNDFWLILNFSASRRRGDTYWRAALKRGGVYSSKYGN